MRLYGHPPLDHLPKLIPRHEPRRPNPIRGHVERGGHAARAQGNEQQDRKQDADAPLQQQDVVENPDDLASCTELTATCRLVVVAPLAGTPAEEAGIQAGDVVLAVDGEPVDGSTMNDQVTRIRGEPGTDVTLTIQRGEEEPFDLTITRAEIELQEVETRMIDDHIGYISLNGFSAEASEQFATGLADLLEQGADQIVFDLRDNPGGYIDAAQKIASEFIDDGLIFTQESAGVEVKEYKRTLPDFCVGCSHASTCGGGCGAAR